MKRSAWIGTIGAATTAGATIIIAAIIMAGGITIGIAGSCGATTVGCGSAAGRFRSVSASFEAKITTPDYDSRDDVTGGSVYAGRNAALTTRG